MEHTFTYKQVIVIRKDLEMSPAKLAVQVAHGSIFSYIRSSHTREKWLEEGMKKVVLQVPSLKEIDELSRNSNASIIYDYGLTEFNGKYTVTGIAFDIEKSEVIDLITGKLKLYR